MGPGTSPIPAPHSHPRACQRSTSRHPPLDPIQRACSLSIQARIFLHPRPRPFATNPITTTPTLVLKSAPSLLHHRHITASLVGSTMMIDIVQRDIHLRHPRTLLFLIYFLQAFMIVSPTSDHQRGTRQSIIFLQPMSHSKTLRPPSPLYLVDAVL